MDPLFDVGDVVLGIQQFDKNELQVGDIVIYHNGYGNVVHRIESITVDSAGRLYRLKGDNPQSTLDPYLVRDSHILYLVVGIIYLRKDNAG